jgi:hypothetical protein
MTTWAHGEAMQLSEFVEYHRTSLEANEVKYNLTLGVLANATSGQLRLWSLGEPGSCAIQFADHLSCLAR